MCPALLCSRSRFFAMFIYVYTHWPEQHLFVHSFRETNLQKKKKGNQSFYLFFRLVQLGWERESVEFFVRVIVGNNL